MSRSVRPSHTDDNETKQNSGFSPAVRCIFDAYEKASQLGHPKTEWMFRAWQRVAIFRPSHMKMRKSLEDKSGARGCYQSHLEGNPVGQILTDNIESEHLTH